MLAEAVAPAGPGGPLVPSPYVVVGRRGEAADVVTLSLERTDGPAPTFRHGQFNMVTAFGRGEIAVSMSSAPGVPGPVEHSIRRVGAVSAALCAAPVGSLVGIRGPFGSSWGVDEVEDGADVVVMAGGIGLAPLRGAVRDLVVRQQVGRGRVFVLAGARSPDQILFHEELRAWERAGAHVGISVDVAAPGWTGVVGVVTALLPGAPFEASRRAGPALRARDHDALRRPRAWWTGESTPGACGSRSSGTCSAASACAGTANSGRCCCAATARSCATAASGRRVCSWSGTGERLTPVPDPRRVEVRVV